MPTPPAPDAAIEINVTRCHGEQERFTTSEEVVERTNDRTRRRTVTKYHARTTVSFRALFEVTDLSTGNVMLSRSYEFEPRRTNVADRGYPEYPSASAVIGEAYRRTTRRIRPLFFGWTERRELVFFDDERCGLQQAFRAVEAGDYERALELSVANVDSCRPDPVTEITEDDLAAAHYNVGILHRIRGDFGGRAGQPGAGPGREPGQRGHQERDQGSDLRKGGGGGVHPCRAGGAGQGAGEVGGGGGCAHE